MRTRDLALRALATKCIADLTATAVKARRAELADEMANGDRVKVTDPDNPGVKVGMVYRTDPAGTGIITDRRAFLAWMAEHYPDRVDTEVTLPTDLKRVADAVQVLYEQAPHLLAEALVVAPWAENEVLKLTEQARQPCGPGGELDVPGVAYEPPAPGVVTVKLSEDGPAVIERLWREGRIELRTGEIRELPAGGS